MALHIARACPEKNDVWRNGDTVRPAGEGLGAGSCLQAQQALQGPSKGQRSCCESQLAAPGWEEMASATLATMTTACGRAPQLLIGSSSY